MLSDFQSQVAAVLMDLAASGYLTGVETRDGALGDPRLADMFFELDGEPLLVMVADHAPDLVRIVGESREMDVPPAELEQSLLDWRRT